jgi:hypothetical protein
MKAGRSAITVEMKEGLGFGNQLLISNRRRAAVVKSHGDEGGKVETGFLIEKASASTPVTC